MSFVVQVWAQPADLPCPGNWFEAEAQREQLREQPTGAALGPLRALVQGLLASFPAFDQDPLWLDQRRLRQADTDVLAIAMDGTSPRFDAALAVAIQQANALGLHLADGLSGIVHLADGRVIGEADEVLLMDATTQDRSQDRSQAVPGRHEPAAQPAADWSITIYPELLESVDPAPSLPDLEPADADRTAPALASPALTADIELRRRADAGDARAAFELGLLHHSPPGQADPDLEQAAYWFQRSAEADDPCGASMLGVCLLEGEGLPRDTVRARYWLERSLKFAGAAATSGTQFQLGRMLVAGWGGPADPQRGVQLYLLASAQGHADAIFNLASCLDAGYGCAHDSVAAKALFMRARALGSPLRAQGLRVSHREVESVRGLARRFEVAADIPARLEERRIERELARALTAAPAPKPARVEVKHKPAAPHAGHFAIVFSALALLVVLALGGPLDAGRISLLIGLSALAAWGGWRSLAPLRRFGVPVSTAPRDSLLTRPG